MRHLRFATLAAAGVALLAPPSARAAFDTEVLSAVEPDKALPDVHLGVTFDRSMKQARISREWIQQDPATGDREARDVRELDYTETVQRLLFDLRIGIFRDLEVHARAPIILGDDSEIEFARGVAPSSTLIGLTEIPASRSRAGFGDMTFGLSWSPVVDAKDPSWPTLTLRTDVITPTGALRDPKDQRALTSQSGTGDVGRGTLTFDLSVALSKRTRAQAPYLDPYVLIGTQLPIAMGRQRDLGLEPPPSGRFRVGSAVVFEEKGRDRKYALDVSFGLRFIGRGRTYSELSDYLPDFDQTRADDPPSASDYADPDSYAAQGGMGCGDVAGIPCGELNQVDQHMVLSARLALHLQPSRWVRFRLGADGAYTTPHLITGERIGTDADPASAAGQSCGGTPCLGRINAINSLGEDERSPNYDPRYDAVGRRLLAERILVLRVFVSTFITF